MFCPRCMQGTVVRAIIIKIEKEIFVCQECEATWVAESDVEAMKFTDYGTFMESIGLKPFLERAKSVPGYDQHALTGILRRYGDLFGIACRKKQKALSAQQPQW